MIDFKNLNKLESGDLIFMNTLRALPVNERINILLNLMIMKDQGKAKGEYYLTKSQKILSGPYEEPDQITLEECVTGTDIMSAIRIL